MNQQGQRSMKTAIEMSYAFGIKGQNLGTFLKIKVIKICQKCTAIFIFFNEKKSDQMPKTFS
jgi:hypothetical protein